MDQSMIRKMEVIVKAIPKTPKGFFRFYTPAPLADRGVELEPLAINQH